MSDVSIPPGKAHWGRAWRALRALIANPERTDQVIDFLNTIGGDGGRKSFERFRAHPDGRKLLASKPSLVERLGDLDTLAALPAGTFGRAYADFMLGEKLDPDGIAREFREAESTPQIDPEVRWLFERIDTMHDLWHVLTGYGRDEAGEAANLAFTLAQLPQRGILILTLAGAVIGPKDLTFRWQRYLYRAWRRGRRAVWLPAVPYEDLLERPLAEVRRLLRIDPPDVAHPEGVVVAARVFSS
jgi:ubiquinone biosynthesis protein COQ4